MWGDFGEEVVSSPQLAGGPGLSWHQACSRTPGYLGSTGLFLRQESAELASGRGSRTRRWGRDKAWLEPGGSE